MSTLEDLTRDNSLLSRPSIYRAGIIPQVAMAASAINCTELTAKVAGFVQASLAPNTRLAYASDLAAFRAWGGTLPASPELVAAYLADHADVLASTTLLRRLASISKAHTSQMLANPVASELVRATMRGIRRTRKRPGRAAKPLLRDDLFAVVETIGNASILDCRDRALLLLGFAGGFRRSELVGLDVSDIALSAQGFLITLRRSKTDQTGRDALLLFRVVGETVPCKPSNDGSPNQGSKTAQFFGPSIGMVRFQSRGCPAKPYPCH